MLEIRRMSPGDAHACATLIASSEPWKTIGRGYAETVALLNDPSREVWVAFDDDAFRGFIILVLQGAFVGYIQIVAVTPDARGQGVGTKLIQFAETRIFEQWPNVFLCVSSFNPRARALYEKLGYTLVGELKDYLIAGESEYLMRKTISPIRQFRANKR